MLRLLLLLLPTVASFQTTPSFRRTHHPRGHQFSSLPVDEEEAATADDITAQPPQQTSSSSISAPDMQAYASAYKTVFTELPFKSCEPSFGSIPSDLVGSYYRAGPAMFSAGSIVPPKTSIVQPRQPPVKDGTDMDRMVLHPFEGDGAVLGVTFGSQSSEDDDDTTAAVSSRFRFVRTAAFTNERKKGERIYKAMDSTRTSAGNVLENDLPLPLFRHHLQLGLNKNRKNSSNTRTVFWGKRLLSLWEGGQPYKLDSLAVSTEGRSRLGGAIKREEDPFGGKMAVDSKSNRALFYAVEPDPGKSKVTLYEFDSDFRLVPEGRFTVDLPGFALVTDFGVTDNYAVFVQPKISANKLQFLASKEPGKTLTLAKGEPAILSLVGRVDSGKNGVLNIELPVDDVSDANLQFVNAYEDGDLVILDAIRSKDPDTSAAPLRWPWGASLADYQRQSSKKSLWRYTIDVRKRTASKRLLFDDHSMFGTINPQVSAQQHRYIYMNVGGAGKDVAPPQGIARFDVETEQASAWMPAPYEFCGEPVYAPSSKASSEEDSGYVLSVLYDGKREESDLVILKASDIAAGPITRIPLGIAVPHGLFGCFAADAQWPADKIERRAKLADKVESRGNMWNEVKSDFSSLGLRFDDMEEYFGDFFN